MRNEQGLECVETGKELDVSTHQIMVMDVPQELYRISAVNIDAHPEDTFFRRSREIACLISVKGDTHNPSDMPGEERLALHVQYCRSTGKGNGMTSPSVSFVRYTFSQCDRCGIVERVPEDIRYYKTNGGKRQMKCSAAGRWGQKCGGWMVDVPGAEAPEFSEMRQELNKLWRQGPREDEIIDNIIGDLPQVYTVIDANTVPVWRGSVFEESLRAKYTPDSWDLIPYRYEKMMGEDCKPLRHVLSLPRVCGWISKEKLQESKTLGYYSELSA